ncbi:hypothetical protein HY463_00760 [Candidatus Peregrinibacteria bacterium]|nr:hypothetical protein [Candidatus Peregrinibacteria bacterium]
MSQIDQIMTAIGRASPEQLTKIAAILGVQDETSEQVDEVLASTETVEVDPRLTKFAEMYKKWSAVSKSRLDWPRVQAALLANDGALLKKAEAIPNGPIMFGADKDGNILFANGGLEPILTSMMQLEAIEAAKSLGFDIFPYNGRGEKSEEELQFEEFTGEPLVRFEYMTAWAASWLDNGKNNTNNGPVYVSYFSPEYMDSGISLFQAGHQHENCGIRFLLRAKA